MKNHFSHKGLFGSQTNCFMAHPILSDYLSSLLSFLERDLKEREMKIALCARQTHDKVTFWAPNRDKNFMIEGFVCWVLQMFVKHNILIRLKQIMGHNKLKMERTIECISPSYKDSKFPIGIITIVCKISCWFNTCPYVRID